MGEPGTAFSRAAIAISAILLGILALAHDGAGLPAAALVIVALVAAGTASLIIAREFRASLRAGNTPAASGALVRDEARLATLVEQIPAIVWTADRDLNVTSKRGAMRARLPASVRDALGFPVAQLFGGLHGEAMTAHRSSLR